MVVKILIVTENKLNCFVSRKEMLSITLPCALVMFFLVFFVDFIF